MESDPDINISEISMTKLSQKKIEMEDAVIKGFNILKKGHMHFHQLYDIGSKIRAQLVKILIEIVVKGFDANDSFEVLVTDYKRFMLNEFQSMLDQGHISVENIYECYAFELNSLYEFIDMWKIRKELLIERKENENEKFKTFLQEVKQTFENNNQRVLGLKEMVEEGKQNEEYLLNQIISFKDDIDVLISDKDNQIKNLEKEILDLKKKPKKKIFKKLKNEIKNKNENEKFKIEFNQIDMDESGITEFNDCLKELGENQFDESFTQRQRNDSHTSYALDDLKLFDLAEENLHRIGTDKNQVKDLLEFIQTNKNQLLLLLKMNYETKQEEIPNMFLKNNQISPDNPENAEDVSNTFEKNKFLMESYGNQSSIVQGAMILLQMQENLNQEKIKLENERAEKLKQNDLDLVKKQISDVHSFLLEQKGMAFLFESKDNEDPMKKKITNIEAEYTDNKIIHEMANTISLSSGDLQNINKMVTSMNTLCPSQSSSKADQGNF